MKFIYACDPHEGLKITDFTKFGNAILNQSFFPKLLDKFLGKQEHIFLHYRDVADYLNKFITKTEIKETDISGLIIPIQHGDINEILNIRSILKGKYQELEDNFPNLREKWGKVDIYQSRSNNYWDDPKYQRYLKEAVEGSHKVFRNAFKFPIFEAYKHLPGHRDTPIPTDLIDKPVPEALDYVMGAFLVWMTRNFERKKSSKLIEILKNKKHIIYKFFNSPH